MTSRAYAEAPHTPECAIMPMEEWYGHVQCDCGAWEDRAKHAGTTLIWQLIEENLWAPPGAGWDKGLAEKRKRGTPSSHQRTPPNPAGLHVPPGHSNESTA